MSLFKKKFDPRKKLDALRCVSIQWCGLLISKEGERIIELRGQSDPVPSGEWMYFAFHFEPAVDGRIVITAASCLWMNLPQPVKVSGGGNVFYPFPNDLVPFITADKDAGEWAKALGAVNGWFSREGSEWQNQWSWRPERVNKLLNGQYKTWVSSEA